MARRIPATNSLFKAIVVALIVACIPTISDADESAKVKQALSDYDKLIVRQDPNGFEQLLVDDYQFIDHEGKIQNKREIVDAAKAGDFKFEIGKSENFSIRLYGDTAVTTGDWTEKGSYKGETFHRLLRFTTIFVKQQGVWRVASDHVTLVKSL